jgi:hypothetical protein
LAIDYGVRSLNYALLIVCTVAALVAAIGYFWTSNAMSTEPDLDQGLGHA